MLRDDALGGPGAAPTSLALRRLFSRVTDGVATTYNGLGVDGRRRPAPSVWIADTSASPQRRDQREFNDNRG